MPCFCCWCSCRGAVLELLLSKVMACSQGCCQVIAMSATMAGLDGMSEWLNARLFMTNFRPVPLQEHAVFQGVVYAKQATAGEHIGKRNMLLRCLMCKSMGAGDLKCTAKPKGKE